MRHSFTAFLMKQKMEKIQKTLKQMWFYEFLLDEKMMIMIFFESTSGLMLKKLYESYRNITRLLSSQHPITLTLTLSLIISIHMEILFKLGIIEIHVTQPLTKYISKT